jgi:hypothetical protein
MTAYSKDGSALFLGKRGVHREQVGIGLAIVTDSPHGFEIKSDRESMR